MPVLIEDEYNETFNFVKNNPKLNIIIPHCGKRMWVPATLGRLEENFERMRFFFEKSNVFFDTGGVEPGIPLDMIRRILDIVGPERLIMGSDTPYNTPKIEMEKLLKLDLNENDMELILSKNIESLISRWLRERPD
jgi:predicted TIM-barrel fold metal-dependent hydrolase